MNIKETLKIMLKGCENHTLEVEIKEKLKQVKQENRPLVIKLGLDPSAPDIHLGHAVVLRKIKQLQDLGNKAVIIIGDFTGMIGDPTGKSKTRKQLSKKEIEENAHTYQEQIFKILDSKKTIVRYNSEWFENMNFREVINLAAKSTVARMLERDDFIKRYTTQQPISIHEFLYPLMQAYDSVVINADIELGGTDQTFNVLMGRDIQRHFGQEPQITLFMPILEGIDGVEKMSKSLGNYIGISEDPCLMYEKIMKIPDNLIIKYYNLCTDVHPDIIKQIQKRLTNGQNPRDIKMELATEIVGLYHNRMETAKAADTFKTVFQKQKAPTNTPVLYFDISTSNTQSALVDTIMSSGHYDSKSAIRRLIQQGALKINGERIKNIQQIKSISPNSIIQIGKGKFYKLSTENNK